MSNNFSDHPDIIRFITWALLACVGGAANFISSAMRAKNPMVLRRFILLFAGNVFVSGFGGLMGALVFSSITPDTTLQMIAAGIFGYMGTQGLGLIASMYKRKFELLSDSPSLS